MEVSNSKPKELLEVSGARVRIGRRQVLKVDSFVVRPGQHWCVFGGNGAGKSLFAALLRGDLLGGRHHVNYLHGFDPGPDCVTVSFEEQQRLWLDDNRHDISEFNARAQDTGTTVARLAGIRLEAALTEWQQTVLDTLGLKALLERGIRFLSSGQVRRALIARALLAGGRGARLVIMDDPLESIDRGDRDRIQALLEQWMGPDNNLLQLCRRHSEILPGLTHMAIMDRLTLVTSGEIKPLLASPAFPRGLAEAARRQPIRIPALAGDTRSPEPGEPLIHLDAVTAAYGDRLVLDRVSWTFRSGQHCLVEGPNGCGKSTLLSLIDGENHKAYGQPVYLFGRRRGSGESVWDIKARFGIVSNEIHNRYARGWKVLDVVVSGFFDSLGLFDDAGASQADAARAWLEGFGVGNLAASYYHEISFGQQRLVLLARAMVKQPAILILDEPCVGLDDYYRALVLRIVERIAECTVTQIIYVTHTPGEEPACINQWLKFVPTAAGHYRVETTQRGASP